MDRGFRVALIAACALVLSSLVVLGVSLHNGHRLATGAPLASLDSPQLLRVASSHGGYDPMLIVDQRGAMRALVTERGGSCVAFGAGLAQASPIALSAPGGSAAPSGIRAAPYCTAAQLPSGALAFAAIAANGVRIVGTLDGSGAVTNGAPLPGPTIVFGAMWLTATPNGVYLVAETEGAKGDCCGITVWHSTDGVSYSPGVTLPPLDDKGLDAATFFGAVAVDTSGGAADAAHERLYLPFTHAGGGGTSERQLWLATSGDGGAGWALLPVVEEPTGTTVAAQYPAAAVDAGGTVYVAWSDIGRVHYAWSKDHGQSFGGVQAVDAQTALNVMPAIVAGDAGHIAIAWYAGTGSAAMGESSQNDEWRPMMAVSGNANSGQPALARLSLSGVAVHRGSVCLLGAGCADSGDGGAYDPRLGAHLALAVDPQSGGLKVAYAADGGPGAEPEVRVVQLHCGERILVRPPAPLPACG